MLIHPNYDPVALSIGPLSVHWYGIMYLLGFAGAYLLASYRVKRATEPNLRSWTTEQISY